MIPQIFAIGRPFVRRSVSAAAVSSTFSRPISVVSSLSLSPLPSGSPPPPPLQWLSSDAGKSPQPTLLTLPTPPKPRRIRAAGGDPQVRTNASNSCGLIRNYSLDCRYRLQTTTSEGMAAHSHSQNCPSDPLHHWHCLRSNRRPAHLGEQQGPPLVSHNPDLPGPSV